MVSLQFGETMSSLLKKQRSQLGGCSFGGPLKIPNCVVLKIECESNVLNSRLDARVDDMISRGLVEELVEFHTTYYQSNSSKFRNPNQEKGIFQSIGFKEFSDFLNSSPEKRKSDEGKILFEKGVELLKIATKRYARTQMKWLKNRFLQNGQRQVPPVYTLDATNVSMWKENVYNLAEHIVECRLTNRKPSVEPEVSKVSTRVEIDRIYECECGKVLLGKVQWESHLKGRNHVRQLNRKKRKMEMLMKEENNN